MSAKMPIRALGRFLEDFQVGDVFQHPLGRTIGEADNRWFTLLTMNTHESHFNAWAASQSEFGRELVNSGLSVAIVLGLSVSDISQNAIANLGWDAIHLTSPVFVGDTLYAESLVTQVRRSQSRPTAGIVSCVTRGLNQDGIEVLRFQRSALVHRRSEATRVRPFPRASQPISGGPE